MATRLDDAARKWTDEELEALERRMRREYYQAAREMRGKQAKWLEKFNREREMREKALDDTPEAMEAHRKWLQSQAARSDWYEEMVSELSEAAHNANVAAADKANEALPIIFAENANMAAFEVEAALGLRTSFTLVDEQTAKRLMRLRTQGAEPEPLVREVVWTPDEAREGFQTVRKRAVEVHGRRVDRAKDIRWNRQKFTSAITQGILQGESIPNIVKRTESVFGQNMSAAVRAARTAVTAAESAGRVASFERARDMGIEVEQEWMAVMDDRTRDEHRELDGQTRPVGEPFENSLGEIMYPGDPSADPANIWNCRCRLRKGKCRLEGERPARWDFLPPDITYEEWKAGKNSQIKDFKGYTYEELMQRRRNG